jgi:hypothetical protein
MKQSASVEAIIRLAGQEIHRVIWSMKIYYNIDRCTPLDPFMCEINPVHISHNLVSYFFKVYVNSMPSSMLWSPKWPTFSLNIFLRAFPSEALCNFLLAPPPPPPHPEA